MSEITTNKQDLATLKRMIKRHDFSGILATMNVIAQNEATRTAKANYGAPSDREDAFWRVAEAIYPTIKKVKANEKYLR